MKITCPFLNFFVLLAIRVFIPRFAAAITNSTTDQAALISLKAHINYEPNDILANNWSTSAPVCSWSGVTCGARQRVTKLDLSNMGLEGTIPSQIGNLSFLTFLSIRNNSFYGSPPPELTQLSQLEFLDFGFNHFSGTIPSSLFKCRQLQILSLSYNNLAGSIPEEIGNLTMLKELYLDHNNISGNIPQKIGYLTKMENLSMSTNRLTGSIPSSLGNCTSLQEINLSENNLAGAIPLVIGNLGSLQILRISDNILNGTIPSMIFNISTMKSIVMSRNSLSGTLPSSVGLFMPNLMDLLLCGNKLDGMIPDSISNATELGFLDLSDNFFMGLIPSSLGNLRYLQKLLLANNYFTSESSTSRSSLLATLSNCKRLRKVVLSGNLLNLALPASIGNLSNSLEQFHANNCNFKGIIPRGIGNLTSLIGLSLGNNQLTGNIPNTIGRLEKLQVLYLEGNRLKGTITNGFCNLRRLAYLSIGSNELTGSIPECIGNLTALSSLNISSNNLTSSIPSTLWALGAILDINMSSNSLSGFISSNVGNLKVVENFDLSNNRLSGEIPDSVGGLISVEIFDLSSNHLSGEIPSSICNLGRLTHLSLAINGLHGEISKLQYPSQGLEFLDLSHNILSGVIPDSFEKLLHLKYFNVSFNMLEGKIPTEGPFSNFSATSYMMNKGLCGASQLLVPHCKYGAPRKHDQVIFLLKLLVPILSIVLAYYILLWSKCRKRKMPSKALTLVPVTSFHLEEQGRRYTYLELQQATDWFSEDNLISTGHFGSVYKGILKDGMEVAIKVFNVEEETSLRSFDVECEVFRRISHLNLVRFVCVSNSNNFKALVMEHMVNGSLEMWLHTHNYDLDILQRLNIMLDIAKGLRYLHQRCIIHCDIKPSNILLDENMTAHVSDFGISRFFDTVSRIPTRQSKLMCTIGYVAPEYGLYGTVSASTDVYSFGILLIETFTGKKPTNEMFTGEMSLRSWVMESLPSQVERVIDPSLLQTEEESYYNQNKCLSSILTLALICSSESPNERLDMRNVELRLVNTWRSLSRTGSLFIE